MGETKPRNMKVNWQYFIPFKCRDCRYFTGEQTVKGTACTHPNKEWKTPNAQYKRGKQKACSFFMAHRKDPLVVYIAGPMSGLPNFNRKAFYYAEKMLRNLGFRPINPAMLPTDLPEEAYMPICRAMIEQCEAIHLLDGWENSKGALQEMQWAVELGLKRLDGSDLAVVKRKGIYHAEQDGDDEEGQEADATYQSTD